MNLVLHHGKDTLLKYFPELKDIFPVLEIRKDFKIKENRMKIWWINLSVSEMGLNGSAPKIQTRSFNEFPGQSVYL